MNNNKFGVLDNYATRAKNYGDQSQMYNGVLLNASARPTTALRLQFGLNLGNTHYDTCELRADLPEIAPLDPYCSYSTGLNTRVTGLAVYLVPKVDVSVSSTFRSDQGEQLAANRTFTSASIAPSLGPAAGGVCSQRDGEPGRAGDDVRRPAERRSTCDSPRCCDSGGRARTWASISTISSTAIRSSRTISTSCLAERGCGRSSILAARFARFSATMDF